MNHRSARSTNHSLAALCAGLLVCVLSACDRPVSRTAAIQKAQAQDPELAQENRIQKLLGEINLKQTDVNTLTRAAGPGLTPEKRYQGLAARHKFYLTQEYVESLRAGAEALRSKFDTFATGVAAFEQLRNTNVVAAPRTAATVPDELTEEFNLKARLIEVKMLGEEMALQGQEGQPAAVDDEATAGTARPEHYTPEDYVMTLRLTVDILERKVQGLEAEAAFYRDMLGLDADNNPLPKQ